MKKTLILFFTFTCLLMSFSSKAQAFSYQKKNLPFSVRYYNTKQGLPQNQVINITEGKDGMVVSTINGVVSYNGIEFLSFIPDKNLTMDIYYELFYNKKSEELFGWASNGNYIRIFPNYETLSAYSCVSFDDNFLVGIKSNGLIQTCSHDTKTIYNTLKTDIENAIAIISFENYYFVSNNRHLYKINKNTGEKQIILDGYFSILDKHPFKNEVVAVNGDLFFINVNEIRQIPLVNTPTTTELFRDIEFLDHNEIMIASSRGLYYIKNGIPDFYDIGNGLISGALYSIHHHKPENCIFIGTENSGLMMLTPLKTKTYYTDSKTNSSQSFTSLIKDKSGAIYSTASKGNIIRVKNGIKTNYLSTDKHVACLSYIDEKIYVGSWGGGVTIYKNGIPIDSIKYPILPSLHVQCIFKDSRNNIWIGTAKGIVKQTPDGKYQSIPISQCETISAYELKNGNLCFGTSNGVLIISKEGKPIHHIGQKQGLKCREIRAFYEDKQGRLWIGTYGGGLYVYDHGQLVSINNKPNCRLNQDVFTLVKSDDNQFYMSSNQGIWSVSEQKLNDFYEGAISYLIPEYYGEEAGIVNTEFNGGFQNNYIKTDNKIYFPSIYGLVEFYIEKELPYRKLVPRFKSIIINDTITATSTTFERSTHTIQFDFYCPSYIEQYNVHYQYKITGEGLPDTWSKLQKENSVSLKMLPPGDYTFSVRGIDSFNDPDPTLLSYSFTIKPFFYETILFKVSLVVLIIINILLLIRFRIKKESEQNKIMNTVMELKLKAIQARMNPHFIFNSLNNIIYLLNTEKYDEAEQLLQDFSLLIRRFLEKSDSSFLTVEEELEIIKLYLAIQQKRYNNSFEYSVECPPELLNKDIPSMLIQPFVENAIIHGISHSDYPCTLLVSVEQEDDQLKIKIEDNGVGREKSGKINKSRKKHVSHGILLVKEKINVMRQKHGIVIDFIIEDLTDQKTGTLVTLKISLNDKLHNR